MNKSQLIAAIADSAGIPLSKAEKALGTMLNGITTTLTKNGDVSLVGFGRFGVKKRSARKVRNPQTGKEMTLNASLIPYFKAGKQLKETVDSKK